MRTSVRVAKRHVCSVARKLAFRDAADLWRRSQEASVGPALFTQLEAARQGTEEVRAALAVTLAKRWSVEQVAATKGDTSVGATFALNVLQDDGPTVTVGLLRAAIWPEGPDRIKTALLFSPQSDPALPLGLAAYPLIEYARRELTSNAIGAERCLGVAALPGLCQWMRDERAWERIDETWNTGGPGADGSFWIQQRAAVEAVALGDPRPSDEAYAVARGAFEDLALEYSAIEDVEAESTAMALAGGRLAGIHWMHDTSEEALLAAAGCTASYEFDTVV